MISLTKKRDQQGFTIVELLIVIVVIGILAALVVTTYAGIQAKARDSKRQTDIQALQTQIEAFYASNNYYPAMVDLNSSSWRSTNMKSLDAGAMTDPSGSDATLINTTPTSTSHAYEYLAKNAAGTECTTGDNTCATYTLQAYLETGSGTHLYTKTNLD